MTHLIATSHPALEELRRQLRENEITRDQYKAAERGLVEPEPTLCDTEGCGREASRIERGRTLCAVCGLKARTARRGR